MYVYLTNLHTLWKLKSSYKDGALDPIFGKPKKNLRTLPHQPGFFADIAEGRSNQQ